MMVRRALPTSVVPGMKLRALIARDPAQSVPPTSAEPRGVADAGGGRWDALAARDGSISAGVPGAGEERAGLAVPEDGQVFAGAGGGDEEQGAIAGAFSLVATCVEVLVARDRGPWDRPGGRHPLVNERRAELARYPRDDGRTGATAHVRGWWPRTRSVSSFPRCGLDSLHRQLVSCTERSDNIATVSRMLTRVSSVPSAEEASQASQDARREYLRRLR